LVGGGPAMRSPQSGLARFYQTMDRLIPDIRLIWTDRRLRRAEFARTESFRRFPI